MRYEEDGSKKKLLYLLYAIFIHIYVFICMFYSHDLCLYSMYLYVSILYVFIHMLY